HRLLQCSMKTGVGQLLPFPVTGLKVRFVEKLPFTQTKTVAEAAVFESTIQGYATSFYVSSF
ncbi:MAG: hypothetical protein WBN57_01900, partial [Gammaproteobacteria bacterium]